MSVDYISALNKQGSGLNITQIVDSLVQAETAPLSGQIQRKIDQKNEAISGYALVAAELGKMKDYAASVKGSTHIQSVQIVQLFQLELQTKPKHQILVQTCLYLP